MATATDELTANPGAEEVLPAGPALARVRDQIGWYDGKSRYNQRWFKTLKVCQILIAAAIPVAATASIPDWALGAGGASIVVLESLQQLQQYQQNWITYRATCERLKHEQFLFLAAAGPYATAPDPAVLLAERVEGLVSQEHAAWTAHREDVTKKLGAGG